MNFVEHSLSNEFLVNVVDFIDVAWVMNFVECTLSNEFYEHILMNVVDFVERSLSNEIC